MMLNITNMDALENMMTSPKMTEWDAASNCLDVVYSLKKLD
tara:strand:+ start:330 stop:452 length:123 start_codon:yes stop_codon:yes gene_type:complete